jgi:hypothetical protein
MMGRRLAWKPMMPADRAFTRRFDRWPANGPRYASMGGVIWLDEKVAWTTDYATPYTRLSASRTETRGWLAEMLEEASILPMLAPLA